MSKIPNPATLLSDGMNKVNNFCEENYQLILIIGGLIVVIGFIVSIINILKVK